MTYFASPCRSLPTEVTKERKEGRTPNNCEIRSSMFDHRPAAQKVVDLELMVQSLEANDQPNEGDVDAHIASVEALLAQVKTHALRERLLSLFYRLRYLKMDAPVPGLMMSSM